MTSRPGTPLLNFQVSVILKNKVPSYSNRKKKPSMILHWALRHSSITREFINETYLGTLSLTTVSKIRKNLEMPRRELPVFIVGILVPGTHNYIQLRFQNKVTNSPEMLTSFLHSVKC